MISIINLVLLGLVAVDIGLIAILLDILFDKRKLKKRREKEKQK